jgi:NADPH:quinone reductase-like Zn-dependent oxidoreductase
MLRVDLFEHGRPDKVCRCVKVEDPGAPDDDEVIVEIAASAINPADLLIMEGRYPGPEQLPAPMGIEGAGRLVEVGAAVKGLRPGDKVISLARSNWAERVRVKAQQVIKLPDALSLQDAAMLKANPPSAYLMLNDYVALEPGDWVIQNAANSAVGRHVIRLARARGLHSANIVRRDSLIPELEAFGADAVLVDGEGLAERLRARIGDEAKVRLAIDAIGGAATLRLADCLTDGGTVVNYGFLSGEPCMITPHQTIVHDITLKGFWLMRFMRAAARGDIEALYDKMARHFIDGTLAVPIAASYQLSDIESALAHAMEPGRHGKVLVTPVG